MVLLGVTPADVIPSGRQSGSTTQLRAEIQRAELQRSGDARGLLDGLAFVGPTGASGMGADHQEKVVFNNGTFRSVACEEWGFEQGQYRARVLEGIVHFEAAHVSKDYGTMTWRGTVREGKLEARYVWEKERLLWDTRREYWFSGVLSEVHDERYHPH